MSPVRFSRLLTLMVAVNLLTRLPFLGEVTLWNIDEGRIAEVAREMAVTGDFVVPRIGGEPFASYPPLPYWLMALSGRVFGFNEFAMRLPGLLAGAGLIAVIGLLGRRLAGPLAGLLSAAVLGTLPAFTSQQGICRGDVMLVFFSTMAFDRFLAFIEGDRRIRHLVVMYGALALAILSKGPLGLAIPGLGVIAWMIVRRRWRDLFALKPAIGLPAMVLAVTPWYVAVTGAAGIEFTRYNLMLENVNAFTQGFEHPRPPWSIAVWATYRMVPWIAVLPFSWPVRKTPGFSLAIGWTLAVFALLTISSSKRPNYLTYLCPAVALSTGIALAAMVREAPALAARCATGLGSLLALVGLGGLAIPIAWKGDFLVLQDLLRPMFLGLLATGIAVVGITRWKGALPGVAGFAIVLAVGVTLQAAIVEPTLDAEGRRGVAFCRGINTLTRGEPVFNPSKRELEGSFHFYLGRVVSYGRDGEYFLGTEEDLESLLPRGILLTFTDARGRKRVLFRP